MDTTPNLRLAYLMAAQSQKHVTVNEALRALDALVQPMVLDKDLASPPGSPADGDRYVVATSPTGAWTGMAGRIAAWQDGAWQFHAPRAGWQAWVADEDALYVHDGSAWIEFSGSGSGGSAALDALAALTPAADALPYFTGASSAALADLSAFGRLLIDDADAAAARATLGAVAIAGDTMTGPLAFVGTGHAGLRLNNLTTTQRDAIAAPAAGMAIWNTTTGSMDLYSGSAWLGALSIAAMTDAWNDAGTTFNAISMDVSDGAGGAPVYQAGSKLLRLRRNGSAVFSVDPDGLVDMSNGTLQLGGGWMTATNGQFYLGATGEGINGGSPFIKGPNGGALTFGTGNTDRWYVGASGHFSGKSGYDLRLFNTADETTDYERGYLRWSSGVLQLGTEKGGSGTADRPFSLILGGVTWAFSPSGDLVASSGNYWQYAGGTVGWLGRSRIASNADGIVSLYNNGFSAYSALVSGPITNAADIATPAGGSTSARLLMGATTGFGIYYGSGAPTVSAAQGSIYLRSDGSGTGDRAYINNSSGSGTTWTALTTVA